MATDPAGPAARIIARAFPGHPLVRCEPAAEGVLNTVYRIAVAGVEGEFALRMHTRDPGGCRKELDLHQLVAARVPVPEVVFADPEGEAGAGPCILMRWVAGETYRQIKSRRDEREIAECGRALGGVLARIGSFQFARGGSLGPGLAIGPGPVEGPDAVPRMIEKFLAMPSAAARLPAAKVARVCDFAWSRAPQLAALERQCSLVHSDFGSPNLVMHRPRKRWEVGAVLDWEFAFSGAPLYDVGHLLRYERPGRHGLEPHFSRAYRDAGGSLPENWRDMARTLDLTALCEMLARPALPEDLAPEIVALVEAAVIPC